MDTTEVKKIGKYEVTGILGRGGMGVVYRAEDKRIGRLVAIKTLTEGYSGQPEMLERFYREAQAGILQHPNIVIVYDLGDQDGVPFIVMEHVTGEPLDKIISSGRALPLMDRLSIIEQVCAALGYAHQRGVVHRDIKPANVIVQPDGHAKIVDFGIARVQHSGAESGLTRTGNVIGTVHYIAPERLKGQPFDGRSDIFSTGVMLYFLLTGRLPFEGEDLAVLQKLVNEPHPPLSTYISNYPPALDVIIDRALAKDPEHRYATAEDFAVDLRAVSEELKKGRVSELFNDAERLTTEQEFGRAREVLLQLVKIDAQHTGAKQLLGIVQQNLARLQRAEQVRHLVSEAEEALASARYPEALASLEQAVKLDPDNAEVKAKLETAREKKRRYDEIGSLMSQAEATRNRGDLTGAMKVLEKALQIDQENTKLRALYVEFTKQAKLAAQQEQIRGLLGNARQEISSRHFTAAIEILREVSKLDPSLPEIESLLQTAVSGQEQERRRKLLEQVQAQIENCLLTDDYDRATELVNRAVEQLPTEASLVQLKTRIASQARQFRVKQLIDTTASKAQEMFSRSPHEALQIVQRALQELPGEERLLTLEDSLRQRLRTLETEEVRRRYLREAQDAIDRREFEAAIGVLEAYQLEFRDSADVNELLEFARNELAQQQRHDRIAACVEQAKSLMQQERLADAINLLDPVCAETKDAVLSRLLEEARGQQTESARKLDLLSNRVAKLRERGQIEEAIGLLQNLPAATGEGAPLHGLLTGLRTDLARKQALANAVTAAQSALEKRDFHGGLESLQSVQRAYGESKEFTRAIADFESKRAAIANEAVSKSVEAARTALLNNDAVAAMNELRASAEMVDFAGTAQQGDWRRLKTEAAKPARKATGSVAAAESFEIAEAPPERSRKSMITALIAVAVVLILALNAGLWWYSHKSKARVAVNAPARETATPASAPIPAAPTGTLLLKTNVDGAEVFVDGPIKGFTQSDGSLTLPLDPGTHSVRLVKPGYDELPPSTITIAVNKQELLNLTLAESKTAAPVAETQAFLTINSLPGASILINNNPQGRTDDHGSLIVPVKPGRLSLQVSMSGYQPFSQSMEVKAGDRRSVAAMLTPIPAPIKSAAPPPPQPVQIVSFSAADSQIEQGQSTTLKWQTAYASDVSIDNGIGQQDTNGQTTVRPLATTTYTLTAKGDGGIQQRQINIVVEAKAIQPPPTPAPAPAPAPAVDEAALLRTVMSNFEAAYNAHDVAKMQTIWTGMSPQDARKYEDFFKGFSTVTIKENCPSSSLNISGDSAEWSCTEMTSVKGNTSVQKMRFSFSKRNGEWTIATRR